MEGAELAILDGFPFGRYTFRALTLERPVPALRALLRTHGYDYLRHCDMRPGEDLDELWVHASMRAAVTIASPLSTSPPSSFRAK